MLPSFHCENIVDMNLPQCCEASQCCLLGYSLKEVTLHMLAIAAWICICYVKSSESHAPDKL